MPAAPDAVARRGHCSTSRPLRLGRKVPLRSTAPVGRVGSTNGTLRQVQPSQLLRQVQSHRRLEAAWLTIRENARTSKSADVRAEIEKFSENASGKIRAISTRLSHGTFQFKPAIGIPVAKVGSDGKKSRTKFRPIVLAPLESRIVQRSILNALNTVPGLTAFVETPFSFGGIKKGASDLAAVPAAIRAVLKSVEEGGRFIASADIRSFFTRISKDVVTERIASVVDDPRFVALFRNAINVELENMAELRELAAIFPIEDIGVAQGNSLSPLMGNIILHDFDAAMNEGDCRCIRYIDDFIIIAPTKAAASARRRRAVQLLGKLGMELSPEKSAEEPVSVTASFEFLGIELANGLIRPAAKARERLLSSIKSEFASSTQAFENARSTRGMDKSRALIGTLKRVDGIVQGWGKHYRFCNDESLFTRLDAEVADAIKRYLGTYRSARERTIPERQAELLGMEQLAKIKRNPLVWHTRTAR